jgi:hypothetical protein
MRLTYGQDNFSILDGIKRIGRMAQAAYDEDRRMFIYKEDLAVIEAVVRLVENMERERRDEKIRTA